jgi:CarD family transcriptional regulator
MQFSVGDKVVHPHHGAGRITSIEQREFLDGRKPYFVIKIPEKELTVYMPRAKAAQVGLRMAMPRARLSRVLARLRSKPRRLPEDHKERQEEVWEKLNTGQEMKIAEVVRDLAWQKEQDHLTKKDSEFLAQGSRRLAAEMALVSGSEVSDMERVIEDALAAAMASLVEQG